MGYVVAQILICLFLAAFIGGIIGWLLRSLRHQRLTAVTDPQTETRIRSLQLQLDETSRALSLCRAALTESEGTLARLKARNEEREKLPSAPPVQGTVPKPALRRAKDDLKLIHGIGPVLERKLNRLGVQTFRQIATWTPDDIRRFAARLGSFPDRVTRDNWVRGAKREHLRKYGEKI